MKETKVPAPRTARSVTSRDARAPIRLPRSLKQAVERLSREDGTSINQFVATALAKKISALETARFFANRKKRADFKALDRIMKRCGGKPPRSGDEMTDYEVSPTRPSKHIST